MKSVCISILNTSFNTIFQSMNKSVVQGTDTRKRLLSVIDGLAGIELKGVLT